MISKDSFKRLREEVRVRSVISNKQKNTRKKYMYMSTDMCSSHQKSLLNEEALSCVLNLFYYYCKYNGQRSVDACITNYSKDYLSNLVNSFDMKIDYNNLQELHNQKGKIKTGHSCTRILSSYCFSQEPSIFALKLIKKYIANNKEDLISEYNKFCNWIIESEIVIDYLKDSKRVV